MPQKNKTNKLDPKLMRGEFSTVVDLDTLTAAEGGKLPDEIPVLPKGEFMTLPYGNMVLDDNVFEQMIGNFKGQIRRAVPVDFDHAWENTKAAGWIKELINKADGLWAKVDWNKLGAEAVADKVYRMISAEWSFDYVDPQKSTHHGAVLVAATLTNRPLMQSMPTITASENKDLTNAGGIVILLNTEGKTTMTIEEILAKKPEDRTAEELAFLDENKDDFTEDQAAQVQKEADEADKGDEENEDENANEDENKAGEGDNDEDEGDEEGDKTESVQASELKRLRKIESDHKAAESLKVATEFSTPFLATENGGKVLPKGKEALIKLSQSLNEDQKKLLSTVLNATEDSKITKVEGEDDTAGQTATEQYNTLVTKLMNDGKSASEANKIVRKEHKKVYEAFVAENK